MHGLQTAQGAQKQSLVAHGQIATFDQRQAQITRQVSVFKISFVVRAWREQGDMGVFARWAVLLERGNPMAIARGQTLDAQAFKSLGKLLRDEQTVF